MSNKMNILALACVLLTVSGMAFAQTTTLSVAIGPEASLTVNTSTSSFTTADSTFSSDYISTTNLTYKIRTTKTTGTGNITLKVTTDFAGTGGPSVAVPPSAGDTLTYLATVSAPGTAATGSQTASTTASTSVGTFGGGASSLKAGNTASVAWDLTNDPVYGTGTYTATVTFTISAT
jgi:hypothetical protein